MVCRIIFDLDDTLLQSGKYYNRQLDEFASFVLENFSELHTKQEVLDRYNLIDRQVIEKIGLVREHFPLSMVKTWQFYCDRFGRPERERERVKCRRIGEAVYEVIPEPLPGAFQVLDQLADRFDLLLYTMGDVEIQTNKIRYHQLERWFDEFHIFPYKDSDTLSRVVPPYPPERVSVVGDSLRGEVEPAIELGLRPVHVQSDFPWNYHEVDVETDYPSVSALPEVLQHLP